MNRTPRVMALAAVCLTLGVPAMAGTLNSPMMFADNNGEARRFLLRGHCSITGSGRFRAAVNVDDANFNTIAVVPFSK